MRVTNAVGRKAQRKKVLKLAKGFVGRKKNCWRIAKEFIDRKLRYQYIDRRKQRRTIRSLWIMRINAFARQHGITYSQLIFRMKENPILNRKMLSEMAIRHPAELVNILKLN